MHRRMLVLVLITQLLLVFLLGCSAGPRLSTSPYPPLTTPVTSSTPIQTQPPASTSNLPTTLPLGPVINTWGWENSANITLEGGQAIYFPDTGARADAGRTLTVTWAANGTLGILLLTSDQYHRFLTGQSLSESAAQGQGASGSVSYYVQNTDTFYVTVKNMYASAAVTVYQAQMTER